MEWESIEVDEFLVLTENNVMDKNVYKQDKNQEDNLQDRIKKQTLIELIEKKKIEQRRVIEDADIKLLEELFSNDNKVLKNNTETHIAEIDDKKVKNIALYDNTRSIQMEKRKKKIEELNKRRENLIAHKNRVKEICDEEDDYDYDYDYDYDCIKLLNTSIKHRNSII